MIAADSSADRQSSLWYKDAVIYQMHVKSFFDSTGDGYGDFRGLSKKLDYLESLGVTALWLQPFFPSPLKDDGYDIADYCNIHPSYGTLEDFRFFLGEAHKRDLRVIIDLVINHTSDKHEWFQKSRRAKAGDSWRDFYVWSDSPERYRGVPIIFKDFETSNWTWDPLAHAYYWHRFYSHQPDLNYENPLVHEAVLKVVDFWFDLGVDGMRLDAIPYLYEKEDTNCESLPETFAFLKKLRSHIDEKYSDRMLIAEANQWAEDAAAYYGEGDMCHMVFHFPLMPRMFMALQMENWFPIVDILEQTPRIDETCQWGIFLRNHDELTLEMVTDEERIFMYRFYGSDPASRINLGIRRRLSPLLRNSRHRLELMNILLFSLPGTPIIYYGDEIGMGDNHYLGDRNGVRTPMQWSPDRNAGFSTVNPQKLYLPLVIDPEYNYETINVETQDRNLSSLLWWMRRVIAMRGKYKAFARGTMETIRHANPSVLVFIRQYEDETILVIINLSRFSQVVSLDLKRYSGSIPRDIFGNNRFPKITDQPYIFTMGFHDYFWFLLKKTDVSDLNPHFISPFFTVQESWREIFEDQIKETLEDSSLPSFLLSKNDTGCRRQLIRGVKIDDVIPIDEEQLSAAILILTAQYSDGTSDTLVLPLAYLSNSDGTGTQKESTRLILASVQGKNDRGVVVECSYLSALHRLYARLSVTGKSISGSKGTLSGSSVHGIEADLLPDDFVQPRLIKNGTRNSSFSYGDILYSKFYKRIEEGTNPEIELLSYLSTRTTDIFLVPQYLGSVEYRSFSNQPYSLCLFSKFIHNTGSVWCLIVDCVVKFLEEILSNHAVIPTQLDKPFLFHETSPRPDWMKTAMGMAPDLTRNIAAQVAALHKSLSRDDGTDQFTPMPFTIPYQRSLFQDMQSVTKQLFTLLQETIRSLPQEASATAHSLLTKEQKIIAVYRRIIKRNLPINRFRIHGDLHLGQFCMSGTTLFIKDFEGDPAVTIHERRLKRSPLRDVASLVYSFRTASWKALYKRMKVGQRDIQNLEQWTDLWFYHMKDLLLDGYCSATAGLAIVPPDQNEINLLLHIYLVDRAVRELRTALTDNPQNCAISLKILDSLV